jgi:hypothetical protein
MVINVVLILFGLISVAILGWVWIYIGARLATKGALRTMKENPPEIPAQTKGE